MKYISRLELSVRESKKRKAAAAPEAEAIHGKTKGMKRRRPSARDGDKMSDMELVLAKPLKASKNILVKETKPDPRA
jgi:hypothetical protein